MMIDSLALKLAWDDLDIHDQKMYLTEAEKAYNKKQKEMNE